MKDKYPMSQHTKRCIENLIINFSTRQYGHFGNRIRGSIELGFLRGYQSGYEDCSINKKSKHYVRSKKEIMEDGLHES